MKDNLLGWNGICCAMEEKTMNGAPSASAVSEINQFHFSSPAARDEEMELND